MSRQAVQKEYYASLVSTVKFNNNNNNNNNNNIQVLGAFNEVSMLLQVIINKYKNET